MGQGLSRTIHLQTSQTYWLPGDLVGCQGWALHLSPPSPLQLTPSTLLLYLHCERAKRYVEKILVGWNIFYRRLVRPTKCCIPLVPLWWTLVDQNVLKFGLLGNWGQWLTTPFPTVMNHKPRTSIAQTRIRNTLQLQVTDTRHPQNMDSALHRTDERGNAWLDSTGMTFRQQEKLLWYSITADLWSNEGPRATRKLQPSSPCRAIS